MKSKHPKGTGGTATNNRGKSSSRPGKTGHKIATSGSGVDPHTLGRKAAFSAKS